MFKYLNIRSPILKKVFVGSVGPLVPPCFGLRMTLPMGFKTRVNSLLPALFCPLHDPHRNLWLPEPSIKNL